MTSRNSSSLSDTEREQLKRAIAALEASRSLLGFEVADIALTAMREKLASSDATARTLHVPQQRKLVTVLFADVSGFTAMSETMDHEIVNDVINSLWSRVDQAILNHGGRIDKHIGDAIMALYGTPTAHEDDPELAIRSALQIQSEIREWKQELSAKMPAYSTQIQNIQLRIGLNTGPALLGTVGLVGEYTAIGDTVNLAQRLEANAPKGGILISSTTHQLVRGIFEVTAEEPITVKGKSEPIAVYTVQAVKPRSFRDTTRGLEGVTTRTIGREDELEQLKNIFKQTAIQKNLHLVTVTAEAGIGKSRLLFEFGKWVDTTKQSSRLFRGRAAQETTQIPYSLLRSMLSAAFEIQEQDNAATARKKLERGIHQLISDRKNADLYAPFIGHLIGFDYSENPSIKGILGDARQVRNLAFHYGAQFFADIAEQKMVLLFLEDIHWADTGSLDFIEHLIDEVPNSPILITSLTRNRLFEDRPDWGTAPVQTLRLDLSPLSEADTRQLVEEILQKVTKIPDEIMELIVKKAEGSPFYVEELIKVLIEGEVIVRGEEQWSVALDRLSDFKVPTTLTGLLQARLDGLNNNARETLQQASVVGRVFWTDIIERMRNPEAKDAVPSAAIMENLGALRTKELIYRYEESASKESSELIFKNQILHDVTYESVLLRFRPVYHAQAAEGLVEIGGERANEYAGRVGEHYEFAGEWLKAAEWYSRAGRQAQNTYSSITAINYYQKALKFFNEHGGSLHMNQKLEVYKQLSEVLNWQARFSESVDNCNLMLQYAEEIGDVVAQAQALLSRAISHTYQGDHAASLDSAVQAETLARSAGDKKETARALAIQGGAHFRLGEAQKALTLGEEALAIHTELDSKRHMAQAMQLVGAIHYTSGKFESAQKYWEDAFNIFQDLGDRQQGMGLSSNFGVIAEARGDYQTAFERYDHALTIAREMGYRDGEILYLTNRGGAQVALKNYEAAEADLRQAISLAGITGSWCMPLAFSYISEALLGLDKNDEAFYFARQALVLAEEDKTPEYTGMAWRMLGMVCSKTNDTVQFSDWETHEKREHNAESCFEKSIQILTDAGIEAERARTLREWARFELQHGNKESGEKKWNESRDIFVELDAQLEVERMKDLPK